MLKKKIGVAWDRRGQLAGVAIERQQIGFIELDRARVLPNVTRVINAAGQTLEVSRLDGFEMANAEFCERGDVLQRDTFLLPPGFYAEDACILHRVNQVDRKSVV